MFIFYLEQFLGLNCFPIRAGSLLPEDVSVATQKTSFKYRQRVKCSEKCKCATTKFHTATEIPFMYSFSGSCVASVLISTFMWLWWLVRELNIPRISPHISSSRIGKSIMGICKSFADTLMWKLGLLPGSSFFGDICFLFSILVLCSAGYQSPNM